MHESLTKLAALPTDTLVYCAHEYTLANLAFAQAAEPGNAAIGARLVNARALREQGLPTIPSTIALERATNPFLRAGEPGIARELAAKGKVVPGAAPVEIFAALREWKNSF
jgi:hydroxyacylglutathione hydrolase